jgi:hypothetical protein
LNPRKDEAKPRRNGKRLYMIKRQSDISSEKKKERKKGKKERSPHLISLNGSVDPSYQILLRVVHPGEHQREEPPVHSKVFQLSVSLLEVLPLHLLGFFVQVQDINVRKVGVERVRHKVFHRQDKVLEL